MKIRTIASLLLFAILLSACAVEPVHIKDGISYGVTKGVFRGRWWSYYERGCSFMAGGFYTEAEADFNKALVGRTADTWQARTYGLHFVEYFPNRELGVVYYEMGAYNKAEEYLSRSLADIDTERAHAYLDLTKRARIAAGDLKDSTAPGLSTSITQGMIISSRDLPVQIDANDDIGVFCITLNGQDLPQRGSARNLSRNEGLLLVEGTHSIVVGASDLADREVMVTRSVIVDLTGPTIGVFGPVDNLITKTDSVRLAGAAVDKNGVVSILVDGRSIVSAPSPGKARVEFETDLTLQAGKNKFTIIATDCAGNETRSVVSVYKGDKDSVGARLWTIENHSPELLKFASSSDKAFALALQNVMAATPDAVSIKLFSPKPGKPYRHNKTLRVSGTVTSATKVSSLTINGQPYEDLVGAPKESFSRRIPLSDEVIAQGSVSIGIAVEAGDDTGATVSRAFDVDLRPVMLDSRASKLPLAILAVADPSGAGLGAEIRTMLEAQVFDTSRFNVVERQQLEAVLTEQQLSEALGDPNQAIRLGGVIPAQIIVVGEAIQRGDEVEVFLNAVSTETSEIVGRLDTNIRDKGDLALIKRGCANLADQLLTTFPRLSGEIVSVRNGTMLVDWTKEDGIQVGMRLLLVEEDEPWIDEDTGEVLEQGETIEVGKGVITKVLKNASKAEVLSTEDEDVNVYKGMAAITM